MVLDELRPNLVSGVHIECLIIVIISDNKWLKRWLEGSYYGKKSVSDFFVNLDPDYVVD